MNKLFYSKDNTKDKLKCLKGWRELQPEEILESDDLISVYNQWLPVKGSTIRYKRTVHHKGNMQKIKRIVQETLGTEAKCYRVSAGFR